MEEKEEILAAIKASFEQLDERMAAGFSKVDQQFATIRQQFAEQLDGVSDGLHAEMRALTALITQKANEARAADEGLDTKIALLGENLGNVRIQLAQYHHRFEVPLEARVIKLEAQVWATDQKKKDEIAAESRRRS